jgi:hypothetical protein
VYDPQKSARGQVSVKAIRLKDTFITLFKEGKLTGKHTAAAEAGAEAADLAEQISNMLGCSLQALVLLSAGA